ncbi:unnamed protein product, partial [Staurois parvus]
MIPYCLGAPMSCQSAPGLSYLSGCRCCLQVHILRLIVSGSLPLHSHLTCSYFFIGFFEFGQGHRGPMIPYCPGAP